MPAWVRRLVATTPRIASLDDVFGMDIRALALLRISIAAIILFDLCVRATSIAAHYGDAGVYPSAEQYSYWPFEYAWSFHTFFGGPPLWVAVLFGLNFLAAAALLCGLYTRVAALLVWALTLSLHHANPVLMNGGDYLLHPVLFLGMFLPWGSRYSLDRLWGRVSKVESLRVFSGWTAAYVLQIAMFYFFAVSHKTGADWRVTGDATYYAISLVYYATDVARAFVGYEHILRFLSFSIVALQTVGPFLLLSPFWHSLIRTLVVAGFAAMHLGFLIFLHIGIFSLVALAMLIPLLPSQIFDWIERKIRRTFPAFAHMSVDIPESNSSTRGSAGAHLTRIASWCLGLSFIVYVFIWQASDSPLFRGEVVFPEVARPIGAVTRIGQMWDLFSPEVGRYSGWLAIRGRTEEGEEVSLSMRGEVGAQEAVTPENYRWRQYMVNIIDGRYSHYLEDYAAFLCRASHTNGGPLSLATVEFEYLYEETPSPGELSSETTYSQPLVAWSCEGARSL